MPFCSTATRVDGPQSWASQGAADAVWCALVASSTQSTRVACSGSVTATRFTSTVPSGRSTVGHSSGGRLHATTSWLSAWMRHPATTPPMLPRPTTATVARCGEDAGLLMRLLVSAGLGGSSGVASALGVGKSSRNVGQLILTWQASCHGRLVRCRQAGNIGPFSWGAQLDPAQPPVLYRACACN